MSDASDIADRLRPIRLPADFASFGFHDALTIFGVGLLGGLALLHIWRRMAVRVPSRADIVRSTLVRLRSAPGPVRLLELARLRASLAAAGTVGEGDRWTEALYKPDSSFDFEAAETELFAAATRNER